MADPTPIPHYMPFVIEVVLHGTQDNNQRAHVWHWKYTAGGSPPSASDLLEFATNLWGVFGTLYRNITSTSVNFIDITARDINAPGGFEATYTIPGSPAGLIAGDWVPSNAAAVISWLTSRAGKAFRGRTYTFGIAESATNGNQVNATQLTGLVALANAIRNFTNASGTLQAIFGVASFTKALFTVVNASRIDANVDSQRRRLQGRGR